MAGDGEIGGDMNWYRLAIEKEDYEGNHTAPTIDSGSPMHDLSDTYSDDIYSFDAARLYGHYGRNHPLDLMAILVIQSARNRPNQSVKIYRAVPDLNFEIDRLIKPLLDAVYYYHKFKFWPMNNTIIHQLREKYPIEQHTYNEQQELMLQDIKKQIEDMEEKGQKAITINPTDWVTINRDYAKEHGESQLGGRYKIISKTVRASELFTTGDSIQEWGYNPQ